MHNLCVMSKNRIASSLILRFFYERAGLYFDKYKTVSISRTSLSVVDEKQLAVDFIRDGWYL